jgi:hypothetical protein
MGGLLSTITSTTRTRRRRSDGGSSSSVVVGGISESASIWIDSTVSGETLWETITDIEAFPKYLSFVKATNVIHRTTDNNNNNKTSTNSIGKGTVWEEIRTFNGSDHLLVKRILAMEDTIVKNNVNDENEIENYKKNNCSNQQQQQQGRRLQSIQLLVTFPKKNTRNNDWSKHAVNTSTLLVETPIIIVRDENSADDSNYNCLNNTSDGDRSCRLIVSMAFIPPKNWFFRLYLNLAYTSLCKLSQQTLQQEINEIAIESVRRQGIKNSNNIK